MDYCHEPFDLSNAVIEQFFILRADVVIFISLVELGARNDLGRALADVLD